LVWFKRARYPGEKGEKMADNSNSENPTPTTAVESASRAQSRSTITLPDELRRKLVRAAQSQNVSTDRFIEQFMKDLPEPAEGEEQPPEVGLRQVQLRIEALAQVLADYRGEISGEPTPEQKAIIESLSAQIAEALREERELRCELAGLPANAVPLRTVTVGEARQQITIPPKSAPPPDRNSAVRGNQGNGGNSQKRRLI
jgi:hypothetical protein